MRLPAGVAVVALVLAGCSGGPGGGDGAEGGVGDGAQAPPEPSVESFAFTLGAGAGLPVGGAVLPFDDGRRTPFEVPAGHRRLEATVAWECDAGALCELELELRRGEQELVTAGFGASPVTMRVDEPPAGRWTFWAFPSDEGSLALGVEGTLTIDLS